MFSGIKTFFLLSAIPVSLHAQPLKRLHLKGIQVFTLVLFLLWRIKISAVKKKWYYSTETFLFCRYVRCRLSNIQTRSSLKVPWAGFNGILSTAFKWGNNVEDITHRKAPNRLHFVLSVHDNSLVKGYYLSYTSKQQQQRFKELLQLLMWLGLWIQHHFLKTTRFGWNFLRFFK